MISIFYGERGSGKTKRMVDHANSFANAPEKLSSGYAVYLDRDFDRMHELVREITLINLHEYEVYDRHDLIVFIKGLLAANSDIRRVYIDSIEKIINALPQSMEEFFAEAELLCQKYSLEMYFTVHCTMEELPPFMCRFAI